MTPENRLVVVDTLHQQKTKGVFVVTGGGSLLLGDLLTVAGASETVLEASVPYSPPALALFLGHAPEQACSENTACQLAMAALQRAVLLHGSPSENLFGLGLTASLASDRPKRGSHRVHLALQSLSRTTHRTVEFEKGMRSRQQEERLVADLALHFLSNWLDLDMPLEWLQPEPIHTDEVNAKPAWQTLLTDLLRGKKDTVLAQGQNKNPALLFPGAFHPLHKAHRAMAEKATEIFHQSPAFELCINNVDKPPLDYIDIEHRLRQFDEEESVWLSTYPTFLEKARVFPAVTFIVGVDTLVRIDQPRYYPDPSTGQGDERLRDRALTEIRSQGCKFLVFGREIDSGFRDLEDLQLSAQLSSLCISAGDFNHNLSSSSIREESGTPGKKRH